MIYFLQEANNKTGPIKIGYTQSNLELRLSHWSKVVSRQLTVLKVIEGDRILEGDIHRYFAQFRLYFSDQKEWYAPEKDILDFIQNPVEIESLPRVDSKSKLSDRQCLALPNDSIFRCPWRALKDSDFCARHKKFPPRRLAIIDTPNCPGDSSNRWGNPNKDVVRLGKLDGYKPGRDWLISRASVEAFAAAHPATRGGRGRAGKGEQ